MDTFSTVKRYVKTNSASDVLYIKHYPQLFNFSWVHRINFVCSICAGGRAGGRVLLRIAFCWGDPIFHMTFARFQKKMNSLHFTARCNKKRIYYRPIAYLFLIHENRTKMMQHKTLN